jgi:fucose 4-O-acetylase-like acetyltransferase
MELNEEQVLAIKQYLNKHLKYQETKDEMFDHILSALEKGPMGRSFGEAMNNITKDIGGLKGIARIERAAKMAAIKTLLKAYMDTLLQICRSPFIIVVAACTFAVGYLVYRFSFSHFGFLLLLSFMINIPSLAVKRNLMRKPNLVNVKNDAFKTIFSASYIVSPCIIFLSLMLIRFSAINSIPVLIPYIVALTFCLVSLHGSVFYKFTRNEFRMKISDN